MKCIKINDVVNDMLSLDLTDFIEEKILIKGKHYVYTSVIRVTYDGTLIRCIPIQSRGGGRGLYDGRTIYTPIASDQSGPHRGYYAGQTSRIDSSQFNEANVPQSVGEGVEHLTTVNLTGWELESIDE